MAFGLELTIGQVSGIIAAGVVVVKLILPNLVAFLSLGVLHEQNDVVTASAVSWSAVGRLLHSSHWPVVLNGDSAASRNVALPVIILKYAGLLSALLVSVAAIVTPLGLFETIVASDNPTAEPFHYIVDKGIFGLGTPARNESLTWSRVCGTAGYPSTCLDLMRNSSSSNKSIDRTIPQETIDLFSSGISQSNNSVSSIFDIQWRSWSWTKFSSASSGKDNSSINETASSSTAVYPIGTFHQISTLALDDKFEVVEGLVVNARTGGIGFRNHSAPPLTPYGSTWAEDLLFIQPVTECVNTNLTIEYSVPENSVLDTTTANLTLVDKGGFSKLNQRFPQWDPSQAQTNPNLWLRAYQAAWLNNVYAMKMLNVSDIRQTGAADAPLRFHGLNSTVNRRFLLGYTQCNEPSSPEFSVNMYGCFAPGNYNITFNLTSDVSSDFISEDIKQKCEGSYQEELGNLQAIAVYCGLVLGVSQSSDGSEDNNSQLPGSKWFKPMYSCATGVEATVKTVTFAFNITNDLDGLRVLNITDKTYPSASDKPLWAVENLDVLPYDMPPLWGLVSPRAAGMISGNKLQTIRKESLLLPAGTSASFLTSMSENLPGVSFYMQGLGVIDEMYLGSSDIVDYTGKTNLAMSQRWRALSKSAVSMATVLNLIWTDYAANAVLGTKSFMPSRQEGGTEARGDAMVKQPVRVYTRQIGYQLAYAIPALMVLFILLLILALSVFALLLGRTSLAKMKRYLNATSAGRIMAATLESPSRRGKPMPAIAWAGNEGSVLLEAK
ncbi:hypothetical protein BDW72DRAFT_212173 [Aspergillus terricola var. indicus]